MLPVEKDVGLASLAPKPWQRLTFIRQIQNLEMLDLFVELTNCQLNRRVFPSPTEHPFVSQLYPDPGWAGTRQMYPGEGAFRRVSLIHPVLLLCLQLTDINTAYSQHRSLTICDSEEWIAIVESVMNRKREPENRDEQTKINTDHTQCVANANHAPHQSHQKPC